MARPNRIILLIIVAFMPIINNCFGQPQTKQFKKVPIIVNGIPYNSFHSIAQDREGFLWLATQQDGGALLKYNGYSTQIYNHIPEDSTSLINNQIGLLFSDSKGNLWAGTKLGVSRYKYNCDCFQNYTLSPTTKSPEVDSFFEQNKDLGFSKTSVSNFAEDQMGQVWIGTLGGELYWYDDESDKFVAFRNHPVYRSFDVPPYLNVFLFDDNNNLWLGSASQKARLGSLTKFNLISGKVMEYLHDPSDMYSLVDSKIMSLLKDKDGRIMVGTFKGGLHFYNPIDDNFKRLMYDPSQPDELHAPFGESNSNSADQRVIILNQDREGGLWVSAYDAGINYFNPKTGKRTLYAYNQQDINDFESNKFYDFHEDRQGQIWVASSPSGGLYKLDKYEKNIVRYPSLKKGQRCIQSEIDSNIFWISSMGEGLRSLNIKSGKINTFLHEPGNPNSIGHNHVRDVIEDEGVLWIGLGDGGYGGSVSGNGGLDRFNPKTGVFRHFSFTSKVDSNLNYSVFALHMDSEGKLWLDTGPGGLYRSDPEKEKFEPYVIPGSEDSELWVVSESNNKLLWVTDYTKRKIFRFDPQKDTFHLIWTGDVAESILEDERGYWFATINNGLVHFNPESGASFRYTEKDGLLNNETIDILSTEPGIYWVASRSGITKFNDNTKTFFHEGLPKGFFHPSHFKSKDGLLVFTAEDGIVTFYPNQVEENPFPPQIVITELQVSGEPFSLKKNEEGYFDQLHLSYNYNDFNITYAGIHLSDPSLNKYKYKLVGSDEEWFDAGTSRSARYPNLRPGKYIFQVKASNNDGIWTKDPLEVPFQIHQAWWKTWWFYIVLIIISGGTIYWIYRFQLSKSLAIQESNRLKELNQLRTTLYNNITHEFRTPLTVILGMTENLEGKISSKALEEFKKPLELIARNGQNLLKLVNEMLDLSKIDSGNLKLNYQQSDIVMFVKYLTESFYVLAKEKNIDLNIISTKESLNMDFDLDKLTIVLSNLLSNAIKFTPSNGKIEVFLAASSLQFDDEFTITIKDNGIGIRSEALPHIFDRFYQAENSSIRKFEGTGIGLALTKELIQLMGGSINVKSEFDRGSEFVVCLPIQRSAHLTEILQVKQSGKKVFLHSEIEDLSDYNEQDLDLPLILIIEDQADVAHYIGTCLNGNYQIQYAPDGAKGIQIAFERIPDLIISDVMMPEKDGFEVTKTLKSDERTNHIPVIMLTARVEKEDRLLGLSSGVDAYLSKPFGKEELLLRVHNLLELRKILQKKYSEVTLIDSEILVRREEEEDPFISKVRSIILSEIGNDRFSLEDLNRKLLLSRSQVHRKIKAVTGMSTSIFIRNIRLQEARKMIKNSDLNVSEIAYKVGFNSPAYFSQAYKEAFGESPSESRP